MTLLIGYGNPGRGDDGLGPALAERLSMHALPGLEIVADYQLRVEHALRVAAASCVVFADAEIGGTTGTGRAFSLEPLTQSPAGDVASHDLSPGTVLMLAELLYGATPSAYLLAIAGTEFDRVHEGLSPAAARNLDLAERHLLDWLVGAKLEHTSQKAPAI